MNKIYLFLSLIILSIVVIVFGGHYKNQPETTTTKTDVITSEETTTTTEEPKQVMLSADKTQAYKIAVAKENKTYNVVSSEATYEKAYDKVMNIDNDQFIILHGDYIVYVKYGFIDFNTKPITENTNINVDGVRNYTNGSFGADGLFINTTDKMYDTMISNARGLVSPYDVEIVPMAYAKSPSYYYVNQQNELVHAISTDIYEENAYSYTSPLTKAPDYLEEGKMYYSYDGIYFYTALQQLTDDVRNHSHEQAVNDTNPFYNYYQYVPLRSKTVYTASDLDKFLKYRLDKLDYTNSVLYNTGSYFIDGQGAYSVNGAIELAWAIHESGYGTSSLARNKYNLFGLNARDENPYGDGLSFTSIEAGIDTHMHNYVDVKYLDNEYHNYSGATLGNKGMGMNIFYASDPYWGEKIASSYYRMDKYLGFKDYNHYKIGFIEKDTPIYEDENINQIMYLEYSSNIESNQLYPIIVLEINKEQAKVLTNHNTVGFVSRKDIKFLK